MKKLYFFLLVYGSASIQAAGQQLEFIRENVVFRLDSAHLTVTADLWLKNPHAQNVTQAFHIPFACEGSNYVTDSLNVLDCSSNTYLKTFRKNVAGAMVQVSIAGHEQKKIKVNYIQNHDRKRAGYILTKVKYWNKPLPDAQYTLIVENPSIRIDSTSIKADNISNEAGKIKQTWHKYNFSPSKELCFYFHFE